MNFWRNSKSFTSNFTFLSLIGVALLECPYSNDENLIFV